MQSVIPAPEIFDQVEQLSTKKARGSPRQRPPPRPPVKTSTLLKHRYSRLFDTGPQKALAVSFQNGDNSILSKHYNEKSDKTYFCQFFRVISKLGAGSFGEVFKVQNLEDKKFYAVKRFFLPFKGYYDRLDKLEEVKKHEQLSRHLNCVQFIKAWEEEQHLYIQTELCEISLSEFAEQNHDIPEKLIWKYMVDLLLAVKHLHDHNLIHMDIKPENIFISSDGICKLGDFGLVLDLSKENLSENNEGDPKYLAPELLEGKYTKAADIFSLGITMLELACDLDLPRGGAVWHDLRHGKVPLEFSQHLSKDLMEVICYMMTPNYDRRPSVDTLLFMEAVNKVLRKRQYEVFIKHIVSRIKDSIRDVVITGMGVFQMIFVRPWKTICSLVSSASISRQSPTNGSHYKVEFSDDDNADDEDDYSLRPLYDVFDDSVPNFENHLANSTPVSSQHGSVFFDSSLTSRSDVWNTRYRQQGSPTFSAGTVSCTDIDIDENNCNHASHSAVHQRNLTELFESMSDEDET